MFTAFLISILVFTNLPTTQIRAVEKLNEAGIEAKLDGNAIAFFAPGLRFRSGSSEVSTTAQDQIDLIVEVLSLNGIDDDLVYFEGHTDRFGDKDYNYQLGLDRAESVKFIFTQRGLDPKRTLVYSYGETEPISDDPAINRRVEVVVLDVDYLTERN